MNNKNRAGFTLIELLVVISVMGIISVSGIAAFVAYNRSQKLNHAALDVVSMINLAKSRAQVQVKPQDCLDPDPDYILDGYEIRICSETTSCYNTNGDNYEMNVVCNNSGAPYTYPILSSKLPNSLTFDDTGTTIATIFFPILKGGVVGNGDIMISDDSSSSQIITVDLSGNITIQ